MPSTYGGEKERRNDFFAFSFNLIRSYTIQVLKDGIWVPGGTILAWVNGYTYP
jgi:hypothetical protein